jgi:hypothetical protein
MESVNRKKFKLKRANEMRRVEDFTKEELEEINKVKHIEINDENNFPENNNENITKEIENLEIK